MNRFRNGAAAIAMLVLAACASIDGEPTSLSSKGSDQEFTHPKGVVEAEARLGARPFGAGMSPDGVYYITQLDAASMGQGSLPEFGFEGSVSVGAVPTNVAFDAKGTTAYVTNQWSQSIGVVDVATNSQVRTIRMAGDPFNVLPSRDGSVLYVTNNADNVAIIDPAAEAVVRTIPTPGDPNGLALNREGTRLYASVPYSGMVVEIETATNTVLRTFTVPGKPQDMAVDRSGERLYVANEAGSLDIIDLRSGTVARSISLPAGGFGLAMTPDKEQIWVGQPGGFLTIIARESGEIVTTLRLEGIPRKIAFSAGGNRAVIANEAGWVTLIK